MPGCPPSAQKPAVSDREHLRAKAEFGRLLPGRERQALSPRCGAASESSAHVRIRRQGSTSAQPNPAGELVITDEATGDEISPLDVNTSSFFLPPTSATLTTSCWHLATSSFIITPHLYLSIRCSRVVTTDTPRTTTPRRMDRVTATWHPKAPRTPTTGPEAVSERVFRARGLLPVLRRTQLYEPQMSLASSGGNVIAGQGESYTRNLVGAAVASASVLKDEQDKWCFFSSSKTSRCVPRRVPHQAHVCQSRGQRSRRHGVSEALAETYTEPFTVYSPRRFPACWIRRRSPASLHRRVSRSRAQRQEEAAPTQR